MIYNDSNCACTGVRSIYKEGFLQMKRKKEHRKSLGAPHRGELRSVWAYEGTRDSDHTRRHSLLPGGGPAGRGRR